MWDSEDIIRGDQFTFNLNPKDPAEVRQKLMMHGAERVLQAVQGNKRDTEIVRTHIAFLQSEPEEAFMHSALCAVSLPLRRPKDEFASVIKRDGKLTLKITPRSTINSSTKEEEMVGVPFGNLARLILIHIITEAIQTESREVNVGRSIRQFMIKIGYRPESIGGGPRGSHTLFMEQLKRLNRCEWTILFDDPASKYSQLSDIKMTDDVRMWSGDDRCDTIRLSEKFFEHAMENHVIFDMAAIALIKNDPTAIDLLLFLAYRLPRVSKDRPVHLGWRHLEVHLGCHYARTRDFKAKILEKLDIILSLYPGARVDTSDIGVTLYHTPAPYAKHRTFISLSGGRSKFIS